MGIKGAILGDIVGSYHEYYIPDELDRKTCKLFTPKDYFTDDTVMSIATKYAIESGISFQDAYLKFGEKYPDMGYGGMFESWLNDRNPQPYNSFGNGSAMRVSYIGQYYNNEKDIISKATESAMCTHNHEEGIKGAVVTAMCVNMAKTCNKSKIYEYVLKQYPSKDYKYGVDIPLNDYKDDYDYDVTCQGTVPVAIRCFLESDSYVSFIRNCFCLKRPDLDTVCAIGGGIAEEFYKETGFDEDKILRYYLDDYLYKLTIH